MRAVDKRSTDGHYTFLWSCQASAITVVANLLTQMVKLLHFWLVDLRHRGMLPKRRVTLGSKFYWLACGAKSEGNVMAKKIFKFSDNTYDTHETYTYYNKWFKVTLGNTCACSGVADNFTFSMWQTSNQFFRSIYILSLVTVSHYNTDDLIIEVWL